MSRLKILAPAVLAMLLAYGCASSPVASSPAAASAGDAAHAAQAPHCSRGCPLGAPDGNQLVRHAFYTLSNNPETKVADWVAYIVDPDFIGGPDRPRNWKADPDIAEEDTLEPGDYDNISEIGMDRGHQAPLEAFTNSPDWREANYLSNITPQNLGLNRGRWAQLEGAERVLAQAKDAVVYVVTGPLYGEDMGELPEADEPHRIPSGYWKVITMKTGAALGFIFTQAPQEGGYCARIRTLADIEAASGLNLFPNAASDPPQMDKAELGC